MTGSCDAPRVILRSIAVAAVFMWMLSFDLIQTYRHRHQGKQLLRCYVETCQRSLLLLYLLFSRKFLRVLLKVIIERDEMIELFM